MQMVWGTQAIPHPQGCPTWALAHIKLALEEYAQCTLATGTPKAHEGPGIKSEQKPAGQINALYPKPFHQLPLLLRPRPPSPAPAPRAHGGRSCWVLEGALPATGTNGKLQHSASWGQVRLLCLGEEGSPSDAGPTCGTCLPLSCPPLLISGAHPAVGALYPKSAPTPPRVLVPSSERAG